MNKLAVITGATGQDGSYLVELLISKPEYTRINCIVRRTTYLLEQSNLTQVSLKHANVHFYTADLTATSPASKSRSTGTRPPTVWKCTTWRRRATSASRSRARAPLPK